MVEVKWKALREAKPSEILVRFLFGGVCTVVATLVAERYGPAAGGLFLAFPAIFPAGATLIESRERKQKRLVGADGTVRGRMAAGSDAAGAALGCIGLAVFGFVVWRFVPNHSSALVVTIATCLWAVIVPLLWELRKRRIFGRTK